MGQILSSMIVEYNKEKTYSKTYIPFENQEPENLARDDMLSYIDVKQKIKCIMPIKKNTDPVDCMYVENLKIRNPQRICCHDGPTNFKPYDI